MVLFFTVCFVLGFCYSKTLYCNFQNVPFALTDLIAYIPTQFNSSVIFAFESMSVFSRTELVALSVNAFN